MRASVLGPVVLALVLLGGCAGLLDPYPEAKYDCEESDCTRCVPIEGAPHPKGHLCSVTHDENPPPRPISCEDPECVGDCRIRCTQVEREKRDAEATDRGGP